MTHGDKQEIIHYWKGTLTRWMSHNCTVLFPMAHCTRSKLQPQTRGRRPVKCAPIAETTPVLHQYSAKWVRNIIQDMNFNMTLIEPSIQVHLQVRNTFSSCTSLCNSLSHSVSVSLDPCESLMGRPKGICTQSLYPLQQCALVTKLPYLLQNFPHSTLIPSDLKYQCLFTKKQNPSFESTGAAAVCAITSPNTK